MYREMLAKDDGFSLTEILVVIVIIGILVLLALPKFTAVIDRTKETEARLQLKHLHTLQQAYRYGNDRFGKTLAAIGFEQQTLISSGGNARYKIGILDADLQGYTARAVSVVDSDGDGIFSTFEVNETGKIIQISLD